MILKINVFLPRLLKILLSAYTQYTWNSRAFPNKSPIKKIVLQNFDIHAKVNMKK